MAKKGIIFFDMDGTLCFHESLHGMRQVGSNPDGTVLVTAPDSDRVYAAYDLSNSAYNVFMSVTTHALCHQLRAFLDLVLVTGARLQTIRFRKPILDFADTIILETGGMIVDADLRIDSEWAARLADDRRAIGEVARQLTQEGWVLDNEGRTSAIRIRHVDNPHRSADEFDRLISQPRLPASLQVTKNLNHIDIILARAGKENAVRFLMEEKGYAPAQSIGIGDDINDLAFLQLVGRPYVLASAFPEVLEAAERRSWCVSEHAYFRGIDEILQRILAECEII